MTVYSRKVIDISLCFALLFCIMLSMCGFSDSCNEMYDNIVRIRIIANSDKALDQEVKLLVRDAVLTETGDFLGEACDREEALYIAERNIELIKDVANKTLLENGFDYGVKARVSKEFFDTRVYDDFTLPAGSYESLVLTLGEGRGENWWCVMFPTVCVGSAAGRLSDSLSSEAADVAYNHSKYVLKFKAVEIFEKIKKIL